MKTMQSTIRMMARWAKPVALALLLMSVAPWAHADSGADEAGTSGARTVLITGANRGIGTARKPESAQELIGLGVEVMQLDVTDPSSVERLSRELHEGVSYPE